MNENEYINQALHTYIYDLEVYPNYFLGVFFNITTKEYKEYHLTDELLQDIIRNPSITLIGFNNSKYDDIILNYIDQHGLDEQPPGGFITGPTICDYNIYLLSCRIIQSDEMSSDIRQLMFADTAYQSIDLKSLLDPLPGLKKLEIRMQFNNVEDLPFDPHMNLIPEAIEDISSYCRNDVDATYHLYENYAKPHIKLRKFLATKFDLPYPESVTSMSEPRVAETILSTKYCSGTKEKPWQIRKDLPEINEVFVDECIPSWIKFKSKTLQDTLHAIKQLKLPINPKSGYAIGKDIKRIITIDNKKYQLGIGGLHSVDKPGIFTSTSTHILRDSDVTSYYPSIMLHDGLYPRGYGARWNTIYREMYDERIKIKTEMKEMEYGSPEYIQADLDQGAYKIVLNSTFGKLSSQYSSFYDPTMFLHITLTGQLALLMLIERCESIGVEVISANTDGILTRIPKELVPEYERTCSTWQQDTGMNLEHTDYLRYARRDVNAYTALTTDKKVKNKGKFIEPDLNHDVKAPVVQSMARAWCLYQQPPEEYIEENMDELTIYDFLYSFSATKSFDVFMADTGGVTDIPTRQLTKTNRWYISDTSPWIIRKKGGKRNNIITVPDSTGAVLMNRVKTKDLPDNLDLSYYIDRAKELINVVANKEQST